MNPANAGMSTSGVEALLGPAERACEGRAVKHIASLAPEGGGPERAVGGIAGEG